MACTLQEAGPSGAVRPHFVAVRSAPVGLGLAGGEGMEVSTLHLAVLRTLRDLDDTSE